MSELQTKGEEAVLKNKDYPDEIKLKFKICQGIFKMKLKNYDSSLEKFNEATDLSKKIETAQGEKPLAHYDMQFFKCVKFYMCENGFFL